MRRSVAPRRQDIFSSRGATDDFTSPAFTSPTTITFNINTFSSQVITTSGFPVPSIFLFGGTAIPGLTFTDNGNGTAQYTGTPTVAGTTSELIVAANTLGHSAIGFSIVVLDVLAFTSPTSYGTVQNSVSGFTITTQGATPTITKLGALPTGMTFTDNGNGTAQLSGTPTQSGTFQMSFTAHNGVNPNATQLFTLTVTSSASLQPDPSLTISSLASGGTWDGQGLTYLTPDGIWITQPCTVQNATFLSPFQANTRALSGSSPLGGPYTLTLPSIQALIGPAPGFNTPNILVGQVATGKGINQSGTATVSAVDPVTNIVTLTIASTNHVNGTSSAVSYTGTQPLTVSSVQGFTNSAGLFSVPTTGGVSPAYFTYTGTGTAATDGALHNVNCIQGSGTIADGAPITCIPQFTAAGGGYSFQYLSKKPDQNGQSQQYSVKPVVFVSGTNGVNLINVTTYGSNGGNQGYHSQLVGQHGFSIKSAGTQANPVTIANCYSYNPFGDNLLVDVTNSAGTPSFVNIASASGNGFTGDTSGRQGISPAAVLGNSGGGNGCTWDNLTVTNSTEQSMDWEADTSGLGSGYTTVSNSHFPDGGIRVIEALQAPINFTNIIIGGATSGGFGFTVSNAAGISGELVTFTGGTIYLPRNPTNPPGGIYMDGGAQVLLVNVALVFTNGSITPGAAWFVQRAVRQPGAGSSVTTQGSSLTLTNCTINGRTPVAGDGVCLSDSSVTIN